MCKCFLLIKVVEECFHVKIRFVIWIDSRENSSWNNIIFFKLFQSIHSIQNEECFHVKIRFVIWMDSTENSS